MTQRWRYETLDMMRGVAALAVVIFHIGEVRLESPLVTHGYLAVDFFFILSGFVVALAYEDALRHELTWPSFVVKRVIRLYPLAMLGAAMGLAVLLAKWHSYPQKVDSLGQIEISGLLNVFLLPTFFGGDASRHELFPGNGPLWSLFFEVLINLAWAFWAVRLRTRTIAMITAISFACLVVIVKYFGAMNIGFDVVTVGGGLARVCFGFSCGVLIHRFHTRLRAPVLFLGPALLALALIVVLMRPSWLGTGHDVVYDLVCIGVVFPAIIAIGLHQTTAHRLGAWLGDLSYPIYVLHFPILAVASGLRQTTLAPVNPHIVSGVALVVIVGVAIAALHGFDEPVRRALGRLAKRSSASSLDGIAFQRQAAK